MPKPRCGLTDCDCDYTISKLREALDAILKWNAPRDVLPDALAGQGEMALILSEEETE